MGLYSENFLQEKIHIHFDKSMYNKGETIWFKAYVMSGTYLSDYSKNFYVDWFDEKGSLLSHTTSPMFESSARGQYNIPEKYTGRFIHAKAYTNWMLNFDTAFLYNKDIRVDQPTAIKARPVAEKQVTTIRFFPEGGDMVGGVTQRVAFLATNQYGTPVKVTGALKNSKNELIDSFSSIHDGMGSFSFYVFSGETYTAAWVDEYGASHTSNLPATGKAGATIRLKQLNGKTIFIISRSEDAAGNFKIFNTIAHMNQQVIYRSRINLSSTASGSGEIPTNELPTGILQVTLFDINWVPIAERVVFVNNNDYRFEPTVKIIELGLNKRDRNKIDIVVEDSSFSNMSVAVTDGGLLNDSSNTIISQMLLAGDIKGYIHNPAYYFSGNADSVQQHLDLVMLTHGWRRFNWTEIVNNQVPQITHAKDTDYLQIKGNVIGITNPKPNQLINLILQGKDSSKQFLFLPLSATGTFLQKGITFYDTIKIYYQFNGDKRLTDRAIVNFQNGLVQAPAKSFSAIAPSPLSMPLSPGDSLIAESNKIFYADNLKRDKLSSVVNLEEVKLKSRVRSAKDILDEKYATGLFASGDAIQFDVVNDPFAVSSTDVFSYLQGRVAGLQINNSGGETTLSWRGGTPSVFLDEMPADVDRLRSTSMSDVAYVKVFRPPFFGATGGGGGGAISVYTRKGGDVKFEPGQGIGFQLLAGYSAYKEFYNPNYTLSPAGSPDTRSTLYWNPFILTDKRSNVSHIEFFNNDVSKKLRVIIEGVNADGKLTRIEKLLE